MYFLRHTIHLKSGRMHMNVRDALNWAEDILRAIPDPRLDAEYLLAETLGMPRLNMLLDKRRELTPDEATAFEALIDRRQKREPLQYILGSQSFMGFCFKTDPRALIPRNDTEALCEEALRHIHPGSAALDLCTGTGALAIAIKKLCPGANVTASDLSQDALSLARENAAALKADVRFVCGDLFAPFAGERFDVIVSNPPYIPENMREQLQAEVKKEPALALFAGRDGLDFYRCIAGEAPAHLRPGGYLCLEIGDGQGDGVRALLKSGFTDIQLLNDLNGLPRVVSGKKKDEQRGIQS